MKPKPEQRRAKVIKESLSFVVEVRDKKGRVLQRIAAPSRSYVEQWNQIVCLQAKTTDGYTIAVKDTAGVSQNGYSTSRSLQADAGDGVIDHGIRIGKGTTSVAIDDYALETPCGEGVGADQFEHQVMQFTEPSVAGSTCSFDAKRVMLNNSGSTITGIKEIACYIQFTASAAGKEALGFRDVLPASVYCPDGGTITVIYTIKATV